MKQFIETLESLKTNEFFNKDMKTYLKNSMEGFTVINQKTGEVTEETLKDILEREYTLGRFHWNNDTDMFEYGPYSIWKSDHFNFWELDLEGVGPILQCNSEEEIAKVISDPSYSEDVEVPVTLNPVLSYLVQKDKWSYVFINAEFKCLLMDGNIIPYISTLKQAYKLTTLTRDEE